MPGTAISSKNKYILATLIALLFHFVGLVGIIWGNRLLFAGFTSVNMLLMLALILFTHSSDHWSFYLFVLSCMITGYLAEYIGTHTGVLFGNYIYGTSLGPAYSGVPFIIGVNWFIVVYCSGVSIYTITEMVKRKLTVEQLPAYARWSKASLLIDGALLATFFDWVMEPVAIYLGFWKWTSGEGIPILNYISWFVISMILLTIFSAGRFKKTNKFAINLLLIEFMFFLLLRTFFL